MRLAHIDVARGLCILFVVLGHNPALTHPDSLSNACLAVFRMPLLFFIAGTFFRANIPFGTLMRDKAHALIKPFLVMAVLHAPFRLLWWDADPTGYLLGTLSGSGTYLPWVYTLWFLPHLWLVFASGWLLERGFTKHGFHSVERVLLLLMLLMLGVWLLPVFWMRPIQMLDSIWLVKGLPLSADILPISLFYFSMGHHFRALFQRAQYRWQAAALSLMVFVGLIAVYSPRTGLFSRVYTDVLGCTTAALAGIVLITQISCALSRWPALRSPLAHCGVNSLFLLLFHSPVQSVTLKTLAALGWPHSTPAGWVAFAVSVLVSLALARLIRRSAWLGWCFLPPNQVQRRSSPLASDGVPTAPMPLEDVAPVARSA